MIRPWSRPPRKPKPADIAKLFELLEEAQYSQLLLADMPRMIRALHLRMKALEK